MYFLISDTSHCFELTIWTLVIFKTGPDMYMLDSYVMQLNNNRNNFIKNTDSI